MVNHIEEEEAKLLYMYSGHDTSIATILGSLKMFNGLAPPYASALLFELFKREEGKHFVRIVYRNNTEVGHIRYLADSLLQSSSPGGTLPPHPARVQHLVPS